MIRSLGQAASDPGSDRGGARNGRTLEWRTSQLASPLPGLGRSAVVVGDGVGVDAGVTVGVDVDVDVVEVRDGVK